MDTIDRPTELARIEEQITAALKKLHYIEQKIVEGEKAYAQRSGELQESLRRLTTQVQRLGEQAREYELGMQVTRQADADRAAELDKHEKNLKARERVLQQQSADLEARKKRFHQLKGLQP